MSGRGRAGSPARQPPTTTRCAAAAHRPRGGQQGAVAIELSLGAAALLLPVAMLVALLPGLAERALAAGIAAQEAGRVAAAAGTPEAGRSAGLRIAGEIAANHGIAAEDVRVAVDVPRTAAGDLARGAVVTTRVEVRQRIPAFAFAGEPPSFWWTRTHRERVPDFRSLP